jgi:hypothetical protein
MALSMFDLMEDDEPTLSARSEPSNLLSATEGLMAGSSARSTDPRTGSLSEFGGASRSGQVGASSNNPLSRLGVALLNFQRGATGQKLYSDELRERQAEEAMMNIKRTELSAGLMEKGIELIKNTPAAQRAQVAQQYGRMWEHLTPGISQILGDMATSARVTPEQMEMMGKHYSRAMAVADGDPVKAAQFIAQNPNTVKMWDEADDEKNFPYIEQAFAGIEQFASQNPEARTAINAAAKDGWTLGDLADPEISQILGFTPDMINTIRRNPDLQDSLREYGFRPAGDVALEQKEALKAKAGEKPLSRVAAEAAAKEGQKRQLYENIETGEVVASTFGAREEMAAKGFQPQTTGRTESDVAANAAARVRGKETGKDESRANVIVSSTLGLPATTTNKEIIDLGGNPDVTEAQIKQLTTADKSTKNLQDSIGNTLALLESNPYAGTTTAAIAKTVTNLVAEADAFFEISGIKPPDYKAEIERGEKLGIWKKYGIDSAEMKQNAITLGYMTATTFDDTGRITENDFNYGAQVAGARNASPDIARTVLRQAAANADSNYRNLAQSIIRVRPKSSDPEIQKADELLDKWRNGELTKEQMKAEVGKLSRVGKRYMSRETALGRVKRNKTAN